MPVHRVKTPTGSFSSNVYENRAIGLLDRLRIAGRSPPTPVIGHAPPAGRPSQEAAPSRASAECQAVHQQASQREDSTSREGLLTAKASSNRLLYNKSVTPTDEETNTFMNAHDENDTDTDAPHDTSAQTQQSSDSDIDLSQEGGEEVHQMVEAYKDKPTVTLPGSGGTITGTAINDWLDDEGNPKYGDPNEHPFQDQADAADSG